MAVLETGNGEVFMKNKDFYDLTMLDIIYAGNDSGMNKYEIYYKNELVLRTKSELEPKEFTLFFLESEHHDY